MEFNRDSIHSLATNAMEGIVISFYSFLASDINNN